MSQITENPDLIAEVIPLVGFTPAEVASYEEKFKCLAEGQPVNLCSEFESCESVRALRLRTETLITLESEMYAIAGWHKARGRDVNGNWFVGRRQALSEKYTGLALAIREAITAVLN
jgi:hypothetical protein